MASPTIFEPTLTLPAVVTSPPTIQFTPGPGCIDPEDHWVVVTSCYADALGEFYSISPSPDWLTCQVTQFGPPQNGPSSCFVPYSAQTVIDAETRFYSGCPSGYTGASSASYSWSDGALTDFNVYCCPTQYNFNVDGFRTGNYKEFTTERDGVSYAAGHPLPLCATSYVSELSGRDIAVQTAYNTYAWEKRQVENVQWDYEHGTMYAEALNFGYTVFHSTHTCYGPCYDWYSYYFSGGTLPPFTVGDTPPTTTAVEEPTITTPISSGSPIEGTSPVEESSSIEETVGPSTTPASTQATSSPTGEDITPTTSSIGPTSMAITGEGNGNTTSSSPPSSTTSDTSIGAAVAVGPTRFVLLGLFMFLIVL
ncbi:hypothetical protein GQX73_g1865 [Xylaria multiplex]|uniref:Uncharacterized protein n=1 Tax=Xylaria multiplex TaxID=323545 RepID=A0A7C8MYR3_9PEZI|nr:hypothetical protein GQX73_g1865 [Xylaria multiplex]